MRFNFRKISAIGASMLVAGMSVGMAAAANYPAPFIQGGVANVAIVYGTGSGVSTLDLVQAGNIQTDLQAAMGAGEDGGSDTTITGDGVQIAKSTDNFNLGDNWNSFYTALDSDELSNVLAEGTYKNDDNDEFDYEQEVVLGSATLTHFTDNDFNDEKPVLGFNLAGGTTILTYTLDFTPDNAESDDADWASFEGTTIEMLGKEYYVLSASNTTSGGVLELLDSASDAVLNEGETITLEAGDTTYEASISFIGTSSVKMVINGETTPSLAEDETYKLSSGDYLGIKEINTQDYQGGIKQVEFSIGSGKIELINGEEIEVNSEDVSDLDEYEGHTLTTTFTQSSGDLDSFSIVWALDSGTTGDTWLGFDTDSTELVMPVFNNLKLSLGNFVTGAGEETSVENDGDDSFTLNTEVTDGEVSLNLLYTNGTFFEGLGASSSEKLVTSSGSTVSWDDNSAYFVATWINGDDYESYVLEITDIDDSDPSKNTTTIESVASGSSKGVILDYYEKDEIGEIAFNLTAADETAGTATLALSSAGGSGSVYANLLVSKEGLKMRLPYAAATENITADGSIQIFGTTTMSVYGGYANATQWNMNFTEEDSDGNVDADVESFYITLGHNSEGDTSVTTLTGITDYETEDGTDDYVGYMVSDVATKTMFYTGNDQDTIDIVYPGEESYAEVFLSEVDAEITAGSGGGGSATPLGEVLVTDSEVSSVSSKNLIIVGGSCINSAAATVLGGAYCGAAFTDATGVGSGQFLIQGFDGAYTTGKLALVVAGYEAADTVNAATYLRNQVVDTAKKYVGTSATSAQVVVDEQ